jgi:hypothetical protein
MESFPATRRMGTIPMPGNTIGDLHPILREVKARPLFAIRLASRPQPIGATPGCVRRIFAVTGGVFEGERLSGQVLDSGNDWQTIRGDGAVTLDVRLVLKTSDDAMIGIGESGTGPPRCSRSWTAARKSTPRATIFAFRPYSRPRRPNTTGSIAFWRSGLAIAGPTDRSTACSSFCDRSSYGYGI